MTQPPSYPGSPDQPQESQQPQQPPAPTAAPSYGAPYGSAPYPAGPGADQPSTGLAVAALVLSFLACTLIAGLVSIVLAVVVLVRGRDGRRHGKGLAIAAIVVSTLVMAGTVLGVVLVTDYLDEHGVENLETGQCVDADDLTDADATEIGLIRRVSCSEPHDGQVLATSTLTQAQVDSAATGIDCTPLVDPALLRAIEPAGVRIYGLTPDVTPAQGDTVACVAVRSDGQQLTEKLG